MPPGLIALLLLLIAMIWSSLVLFGGWGLFVSAVIGIFLACLNRPNMVLRVLLYFMIVLVGIALLLPVRSCANKAARRMQCCSQMKQIGLALFNYREANGSFPPAYVADKNGKPVHSWRVLLLPYCEQSDLFKQYRFDEPWDGPKNKALLTPRPRGYACGSNPEVRHHDTCTSYVAVVGANAAWSEGKPKKLTDEQAKTTILLVEVAGTKIPWLEPKDLDLDRLAADPLHPDITVSSLHWPDDEFFIHDPRPGTHVALADGSVRFLPGGLLAPERLPELIKVGGFHDELLQAGWRARGQQIYGPRCIAVVVWPVSVIWLLVLAVRGRRKPDDPGDEDDENTVQSEPNLEE